MRTITIDGEEVKINDLIKDIGDQKDLYEVLDYISDFLRVYNDYRKLVAQIETYLAEGRDPDYDIALQQAADLLAKLKFLKTAPAP